jgi:hypothetical protein
MAIWLQWRSDDACMVHPNSFFVKRRSQPMEEHRPRKLLDQDGLVEAEGRYRGLGTERKARAFGRYRVYWYNRRYLSA